MTYDDIVTAIRDTGLISRGAFHPVRDDEVPEAAPGERCKTLVIVGNAGPELWQRFKRSPEFSLPVDPLNAYSRRVVGELAGAFNARALFPFSGPPFLPFLKWAQKAEPVWPSPIGPLIHAEYGLWHAYRGALAFAEKLALPPKPGAQRPCDTCETKPCLDTCPADAFSVSGYDVPRCLAHIDSRAGVDCLSGGCLARRACPVGRRYAYAPEQAEFHMRAFLKANRRSGQSE